MVVTMNIVAYGSRWRIEDEVLGRGSGCVRIETAMQVLVLQTDSTDLLVVLPCMGLRVRYVNGGT